MPTCFENAVDQKLVDEPIFSFFLGNSDDEAGELMFGGMNADHYSGDITWVNLLASTYWEITLGGLNIDGKSYVTDAKAIVDSGTSILTGPTEIVASIAASIGAKEIIAGEYMVGCNYDTLPNFDFVIDGEMGVTNFAAGLQFRKDELQIKRNDISRVEFDASGNLTKFADLLFLGGGINVNESRNAWGAFAEWAWDATDALELRFAGRYENLDSDSTFDPKLSVRFQATETLVLRASASSSFREPSLHQLYASSVGLQGIQDFNAAGVPVGGAVFIRIAQNANEDLSPEQSENLNVGLVWDPVDSLHVTLDYWAVNYEDVITIENAQGKVFADPAQSDVKRNSNGDLIGVTTNFFNAAEVEADGVDIGATYFFPESNLWPLFFANCFHSVNYKT